MEGIPFRPEPLGDFCDRSAPIKISSAFSRAKTRARKGGASEEKHIRARARNSRGTCPVLSRDDSFQEANKKSGETDPVFEKKNG